MSHQTIATLFQQTLKGAYDDEQPWKAVRELHHLGDERVLEQAASWCVSEDPLKRARGADVLSQLGKSAKQSFNNLPEQSFEIVSKMLKTERDSRPLASAIYALGHIGNPLAIPLIAPFHLHPTDDIRFSVVFALGCFPEEPDAIETLLILMSDAACEVRDWATFGLGVQGSADTVEIRDALVARLSDPDESAREEAALALARRRDARVVPTLLEMLRRAEITDRVTEAASALLQISDGDLTANQYIDGLRCRYQP